MRKNTSYMMVPQHERTRRESKEMGRVRWHQGSPFMTNIFIACVPLAHPAIWLTLWRPCQGSPPCGHLAGALARCWTLPMFGGVCLEHVVTLGILRKSHLRVQGVRMEPCHDLDLARVQNNSTLLIRALFTAYRLGPYQGPRLERLARSAGA